MGTAITIRMTIMDIMDTPTTTIIITTAKVLRAPKCLG
jgi:hypothetical protein